MNDLVTLRLPKKILQGVVTSCGITENTLMQTMKDKGYTADSGPVYELLMETIYMDRIFVDAVEGAIKRWNQERKDAGLSID